MLNNAKYYNNKLLFINNIYRFHNNNNKSIKEIIITSKIKDLSNFKDIKILKCLILLELIFQKKPHISKIYNKHKNNFIICKINIHKNKLFDIITLFNIFFFTILKKRNIKLEKNFNNSGLYNFILDEINIFPNLPNEFFNWNNNLQIYISFSIKDIYYNKYILHCNGFKLKN